jgi:acyl dehydratase
MDTDNPFEMLEALDIDLRRVLHGEQKFIYHAPVVVGDELTLQSTVTGVTQKKGGAMTLIDVTTRIVNQRGAHVADAIRVVVVRNQEIAS